MERDEVLESLVAVGVLAETAKKFIQLYPESELMLEHGRQCLQMIEKIVSGGVGTCYVNKGKGN